MDLKIAEPLTLPCGLTFKNRLCKAAMTEQMSDKDYLPDDKFQRAYGRWADGGWGMILTGNVQVETEFLGQPRDTGVNPSLERRTVNAWTEWAQSIQSYGTPAIMQLNHPGRQSPRGAGTKHLWTSNIAPSAIPIKLGDDLIAKQISNIAFGTPREMTEADIHGVVDQFAYAARLAAESGFAGVQLHAAHGYLLSLFLSPATNQRSDKYGQSPENRARIIVEIVAAIRKAVPKSFCICIKLNSVDHQSKADLSESVEQIKVIVDSGIDFLEISGGSYENPKMFKGPDSGLSSEKAPSDRTKAREAFFIEFARAIRSHFPGLPLMVTGGFRSRQGMEEALTSGSCDLIGIGRPACVTPDLPRKTLLSKDVADEDARARMGNFTAPFFVKLIPVKNVGSGLESKWYGQRLQELAGPKPDTQPKKLIALVALSLVAFFTVLRV